MGPWFERVLCNPAPLASKSSAVACEEFDWEGLVEPAWRIWLGTVRRGCPRRRARVSNRGSRDGEARRHTLVPADILGGTRPGADGRCGGSNLHRYPTRRRDGANLRRYPTRRRDGLQIEVTRRRDGAVDGIVRTIGARSSCVDALMDRSSCDDPAG